MTETGKGRERRGRGLTSKYVEREGRGRRMMHRGAGRELGRE